MRKYFVLLACLSFAATRPTIGAVQPAADAAMGVYEGFWTTKEGHKGRVSAQVRPIGGGNYDGFVAFYKSKMLEGALKLKPGPGKFEGESAKASGGGLTLEMTGSAEVENGKLKGTFKGEFGDGTFEGAIAHPKSRTLGAKPPRRAKVLFDGKPAADAWKDFHWKVTPEGTMIVQNGDIHAKGEIANFL